MDPVIAGVVPWWNTWWVALPVWTAAGIAGMALAARRRISPPPPPLCEGVEMDGGHLEGIDYVELRSGKAGAELTLPMLVVLHGGSLTAAGIGNLAATGIPVKARVIAPSGFYVAPGDDGEGHATWTDPSGEMPLREDASQLASFLEQIRRCRPTVGKPVIAGYDEGADLAYLLAVQHPDLVDSVVMAGGMPDLVAGLPAAPVRGLHGQKDEVYPYDEARDAYHELIASGAPVHFLRMFGVGHSFAGALQIKLWQEASRALAALGES